MLVLVVGFQVVPIQAQVQVQARLQRETQAQPQARVPAAPSDPDPARFARDFQAFAEYDQKNSAPRAGLKR